MAETLGLSVRLLVVRCLAFAVVQALIRARVNAGAIYVLLADFQSDGVLIRLHFDLQRDLCSGSAYDRAVMLEIVRSCGRSVLIEYARAGRRSIAMMGTSWIKLRRELSPPVSGSS